jgi:hypothetical protein
MAVEPPAELLAYYAAGKALVCELERSPYICEFWPLDELETYNSDYEVPKYAPGFLGFATSGGGEMFAVAPGGSVVCLPFIGMDPGVATTLAPSWNAFERELRSAL